MRIAIIGAHGVGKTTLVRALTEGERFVAPIPTPMHNPVAGRTKSLQDCSNKEVLRLSQRRYTERIQQEQSSDNIISDGSVIHEWVYAHTRLRYGIFPSDDAGVQLSEVSTVQLDLIDDFIQEALAYAQAAYDEVFFIPVEFPLPSTDAPISDRFQQEASNHLFRLSTEMNRPLRVLHGTADERRNQVLSIVMPG